MLECYWRNFGDCDSTATLSVAWPCHGVETCRDPLPTAMQCLSRSGATRNDAPMMTVSRLRKRCQIWAKETLVPRLLRFHGVHLCRETRVAPVNSGETGKRKLANMWRGGHVRLLPTSIAAQTPSLRILAGMRAEAPLWIAAGKSLG